MIERSPRLLGLALALAGAACAGRAVERPIVQAVPAVVQAQPPLPGCTAPVAARLARRIVELEQRVQRPPGMERPPAPIALDAARSELGGIWRDPCLSALARFFPVPEAASRGELEQLFEQGLARALLDAIGAKWSKFGERLFVIPPLPPRPLAAEAERALVPWLCASDETACGGRAASYVARAEAAFDQGQRERELFARAWPGRDGGCRELAPLEQWAQCAIGNALWTHRYAPRRYRAPERGWLVLRGRRGHYEFADELHAYDLQTGSAYLARSASALVLDATEVDQNAVDQRRKLTVIAGTVATDQARELAFVLATLAAVMPVHDTVTKMLVPPGLGRALSEPAPRRAPAPRSGPAEYGSSAQTEIAFSLIEAGKTRAEGAFTWPDSWKAAEDHADALLRVLEAGIESRCPPAALPRGIALGSIGAVSAIDADPERQADVFQQLARALEGFVAPACARPARL